MNATMEISRGLQKRKIQDGKKLKDVKEVLMKNLKMYL